MSTGLLFVPRGPILFRENRSFSIGGVAHGVDPAPSVFYGAVRTMFLLQHGIAFSRYVRPALTDTEIRDNVWAEIGSPTQKGRLRIKGPFPHSLGRWLFPPPHNYFTNLSSVLPGGAGAEELTDLDHVGLRPLSLAGGVDAEPYRKWMTLATLQTWLLEQAREELAVSAYLDANERHDWVDLQGLYARETRFGHRRDPVTLRSLDKHLFSLEMVRAEEVCAAGQVETAAWSVVIEGTDRPILGHGSVWLGGRSRRCDVQLDAHVPDFSPARAALESALSHRRRCFLYLATPAIFAQGWRPRDLPGLTLVAAAIGKPGAVGGWDMAANRARATSRTVPGGSMFFYEGEPAQGWPAFLDARQFESISDNRPEAGFGIALVGAW